MNAYKGFLYIPLIVFTLVVSTLAPQVFADETVSDKKWGPRFTFEYRSDRSRSLARFDALVPLWQKSNALLFSDLRYVDVSGTGFEGNLGMGYRKLNHNLPLLGGDWIWGAYGFFDRRKTSFENYFSQWTIGTELLAPQWSFRANGYFPETKGYVVRTRTTPSTAGPTLSGTNVIGAVGGTSLIDKEWALPGFDVEVGYGIKTIPDHTLWLYAGYFNFDRSETVEIAGPRVRFEYRMQDLFDWKGSIMTLGAEIRDDDIGGTDGLVLARLSIPIGKKLDAPAQGFERRMTEFVQRDVDVVTLVDIDTIKSAGAPSVIVDPETGEPLNVYIVNNDGTGDCTQDNPCSLSDVAADSSYGTGDVIVLVDSAGNIVGNIDLNATVGALGSDRRQVVGVGNDPEGNIVLNLSSGDNLSLNGLGGRPILEGSVILANESQLIGFGILSPGTAISGNNVDRPVIRDINVINAENNALQLEGMISSAVISDFSVQQVGGTAVDLSGTSGSLDFGTLNISGLGSGTGLNLNGSSANVMLNTLNISGTGAPGSVGVDMRGATGSLIVTNAGTIQNVVTGFDFDANSNATLEFQNGTINAGIPMNTVGVTQGTYDFTGTTFIKDNTLSLETGFGNRMYFVDATGDGPGTPDNPTSADFVETNAAEGDIIFLVEEGGTGNIIATDGLQLRNRQQILGFATGGAEADFTGVNPLFLGDIIYLVDDPTGNGAATLQNNGGFAGLELASGVRLSDFNLFSDTEGLGIVGVNFSSARMQNIDVRTPMGTGILLEAARGEINISDSNFVDAGTGAFSIIGGDANITVNNTVIAGRQANGLINVSNTTGGSIRFDAATSISSFGGTGLFLNNIGGDITFDGPVDVTTDLGNAVSLTDLGTSTVSFNDRLTIRAFNGSGLVIGGGSVNIAGGSIEASGTGIIASDTTVDIILDTLSATDDVDLNNVTGTIDILDRP